MVGLRRSWLPAGLWLGLTSLVAEPAWSQGGPVVVTNLPHKGILAVQAPGQLDIAIIDAIADVGAEQVVAFPAFSDVADFIARKCGKPSLTVQVHPRYRDKLLAKNKNEAAVDPDPLQLTEDRSLTLPACAAGFALRQDEFEVPNGIQALMQKLSIPFDMDRFRRLTRAQDFKAAVVGEFSRLAANPHPDGQACRTENLAAFFACVNAIEIAHLNRDRIKSADQIVGKLRIPVAPLANVTARIPISAEKAQQVETLAALQSDTEKTQYQQATGIANITPITGPTAATVAQPIMRVGRIEIAASVAPRTADRRPAAVPAPSPLPSPTPVPGTVSAPPLAIVAGTIENDVKFVASVADLAKFDPACSNAHELKRGHWPFDSIELMRVLALNYDPDPELPKPRVLVVDTGFDFAHDEGQTPPVPERYIFPKDSFARNMDRTNSDVDGIRGNFEFAGVNLAMNGPSAATHVLDRTSRRSHGLSVTALALGGRDLHHLRVLKVLKTKVGIASLVSTGSQEIVLDKSHIDRIMRYATARENDFRIVNLSLSTRDQLQGFQSQIRRESGRVFVVAAGNDDTEGKPLHEEGHKVYPAALGGAPSTDVMQDSVVITVGAHKANGKHAGFSHFSNDKVDVLAPGCMVPSYELRKVGDAWADPPRVVESHVTGTSFAAPIVSFLASVLMSDPATAEPGVIKERVIVGTDFDFDLKPFVFSAGRVNPAKMLSTRYDVLETLSPEGRRQIRFGFVTNKETVPAINCDGEIVSFKHVKKLAHDKEHNKVLLVWNREPQIPRSLKKATCDPSVLTNVTYQFEDIETGEEIPATAQVVDYVAKR